MFKIVLRRVAPWNGLGRSLNTVINLVCVIRRGSVIETSFIVSAFWHSSASNAAQSLEAEMSRVPVHLLLASAILVMASEAGACPSGCFSYGYLRHDVDCSKRGPFTSGCAAYNHLSHGHHPYRVADARPVAPNWVAYSVCGQGLYPWDSVDCRTLYWRTKHSGSASKLISPAHSRQLRTALPSVRSTTKINSKSSQVARPVAPRWIAHSVCGQGLYPWDSVDCRTLYWRSKDNGSASKLISSGHSRRLRPALPPVRSAAEINSTSSQVAKPAAPRWVAYRVCGQGLYPWDSVDCGTLYWRTKNNGSASAIGLISSGHGRRSRPALPPVRSATKINSISSEVAKPDAPRENACSQYPNLC